jgi:1,4-alpha-glucan branching enzyme
VPAPARYIGQAPPAGAEALAGFRELPLRQHTEFPELWEIEARACGLADGRVCFYWFKVRDADPYAPPGHRVLYCTDPTAYTVDRRFTAPVPAEPGGAPSGDPASVVLLRDGRLVPCDPGGETASWVGEPAAGSLSANNHLVIYELPPRWTLAAPDRDGQTVGTGTFRDVLSLLEVEASAPDFSGTPALARGAAHLVELGANALELLPPADSDDKLDWGYGTAHPFAADFDLGRPHGQEAPTASADLARLVAACHRRGIRFFLDVVMAFARNHPYRNVGFLDFFVRWRPAGDPERDPEQGDRDGFGGDLFKLDYRTRGYHPRTGREAELVPAREYLQAHLAHWMEHYRVDGLRLDSVNNIACPEFLREFRDHARELWAARGGTPETFLVVAEDLAVPLDLLREGRLDGLWNEHFKRIARQVILGRSAEEDPGFEASVRKLIDCRRLGFRDGAEAVNYLTSHDVGGSGNERLHDYLQRNGVADTERRIKLAFVCLLTAVGIPMILAGEEFADQHDLSLDGAHDGRKQVDPVNYNRLEEAWRRRVFAHVARLVRLRTTSAALGVNDTEFIHADFETGRRVLAWKRGTGADCVVVVANFSDWGTADAGDPRAEYVVRGFPGTPPGRRWREVTQERIVPEEWVGREPLHPWEAKVYALL